MKISIRIIFFIILLIFIILFRGQIFELLRLSRPYLLFIFLILILVVLFFNKEIIYYLFSKKEIAPARQIEVFLTFILLLVMIFQAITLADQEEILDKQKEISKTQTEILDKQADIMNKVSQPIRPDIFVYSTGGPRTFPLESVNNGGENKISLTMVNLGRTNSSYVSISPASNNLFVGQFLEGENSPDTLLISYSLESLEEKSETLLFKLNPSYDKKISSGLTNITLGIRCDKCVEQRKYQNIEICLAINISNAKTECGNEWPNF